MGKKKQRINNNILCCVSKSYFIFVSRGEGEMETSSDWIKNKVIPPLQKLCPSKYINYDYFETTAKIPDSMLYQYIEEKTQKTLSSGAIIPLSDKDGTNLFGISIIVVI